MKLTNNNRVRDFLGNIQEGSCSYTIPRYNPLDFIGEVSNTVSNDIRDQDHENVLSVW